MTRIYREERFRTPLEVERALGLWVDRIGAVRGVSDRPEHYRVLGQFAAVAVERGEGALDVVGAPSTRAEAGDVILLFPDMAMRYRPDRDWDIRWVVWNGPQALAAQRAGYIAETHAVVRGAAPVVRQAFDCLAPLMVREDRVAALERLVTVLEMIREFNVALAAASPPHTAVRLAIEGLARDPARRLSIGDLARAARMTPAYFRRLFAAATGTTPKAFQLAKRINRAKEMLASGRSIKETAEGLGFSDVFHFMRVFKKLTNQTAGRYAGYHRR